MGKFIYLKKKRINIMFITKKNRKIVYQKLFIEGALYTPKDKLLPSHPLFSDTGIRNIEIMNLMTSLKSREYVTEDFCWQHSYWTLTDSGIEYLRGYLNIPVNILPATRSDLSQPVISEHEQHESTRRYKGFERRRNLF